MFQFLSRIIFVSITSILLLPEYSKGPPQNIMVELIRSLNIITDPVDANDSSAAANVSRANRGEATIRPNGEWYAANNILHPEIGRLIELAHVVNEMSDNPSLRENALEQADRLCEDIREKLSGSLILFREEDGSLNPFLYDLLEQIQNKLTELRLSQLPINRLVTNQLNELLTRFPILITRGLSSSHPDIPKLMELMGLVVNLYNPNSARRGELAERVTGPEMQLALELATNLAYKNRGTEFAEFFQGISNRISDLANIETPVPIEAYRIFQNASIWTPEPFSRRKAKDWRKFIKSPKIDRLFDCGLFCLFRWMIDVTSLETLIESTRQIEEHLDFFKNKLGDEVFSITFHSTLGMLRDFRGIIGRVSRILNQENPTEDRSVTAKDKSLFVYLVNQDQVIVGLRNLKSFSLPLLSCIYNLDNSKEVNSIKESLEEIRTRNYSSNQNNNRPPSDLGSQFNKYQSQVIVRMPNLLNLYHNEIPGTITQRVDTSTIGFSGSPGPQVMPLEKRKVSYAYKGHYHRQMRLQHVLTRLSIIFLGFTSLLNALYR